MAADLHARNGLARWLQLFARIRGWPWVTITLWATVIMGAALRARHYTANRSLWLDEALLANALFAQPVEAFAAPLTNNQVAPVGYLLAVHGAVAAFGQGEQALRLVAFLCSLAALPLFILLARSFVSGPAVVLAAAFFAIAAPQIYFAAEVKPYGSDVAVALVFWLFGAALLARTTWPLAAATAVVGAALVWCSLPAAMMAAGVGATLVAASLGKAATPAAEDRAALPARAVVATVWAASFGAYYVLVIRPASANDFLQAFWSDAFAPLPPRSFSDVRWYLERFLHLFGEEVAGFNQPGLAAFAALAGMASLLAARRRAALALLVLPALAALAAAALQRYPFEGRLLLFLAPALLMLAAEGLVWLHRSIGSAARWLTPLAALLLLAGMAIEARGLIFAPVREELRPVLVEVAARPPDERVYVYYGAEAQTRYYAPRLGLDPSRIIYGGHVRGEFAALARELAALHSNRRAWVIFAHVHSARGVDEEWLALFLLDAEGRRLETVQRRGAAAYLYEFRP